MSILTKWLKLPQWQQTIIGLFAGIITGLVLKAHAVYLKPIGTMFVNGIQMLVAPVVFTAIICAVLAVQELNKIGRMMAKALVVYALTMAVAATIGIIIANALGIGYDFPINKEVMGAVTTIPSLTLGDILVNFVPKSPVAAFASNNVMQILCFAFIFGLALRLVGEPGKPIKELFLALAEVVFLFAKIVVGFAPYGVFALIAYITGQYGVGILLPLIKFVSSVYISCGLLIVVVFSLVLLAKQINPITFFSKITEPLITSFTTSSSAATLPVTMRCARENLKINPQVSDFLLPFGATLNLNGLAIYLSAATIFAAHMYSITISFAQYVSMVITVVLTSAGAAAIPGSGLIVMSAVMTSVGIPLSALPIIAGVDRFNDMAQTMTNVAGDLFATTVVAKSEALLDDHKVVGLALNEKNNIEDDDGSLMR